MVVAACHDSSTCYGHGTVALDGLGGCSRIAAVSVLAACGGSTDGAVRDGQHTVGLDALAARTSAFQRQRTSADGHIVVGFQTGTALSIPLITVVGAVSSSGHNDVAVRYNHVAIGLDALGGSSRYGDVQRATL